MERRCFSCRGNPRKEQFDGGDNGFGQDKLSAPCLKLELDKGQWLRRRGCYRLPGLRRSRDASSPRTTLITLFPCPS